MLIKSFYHLKLHRLGLILIIIIIILGLIYGMSKTLDMNPSLIVEQMEQWGHWAVFGFLGLYFTLTIVGIPAIPITVAGGVFFGIFWGTLWSVIGANLGAIAAFGLTRSCLRNWVQKTFGHHPALIRFNRAATRMPLRFVLFIRYHIRLIDTPVETLNLRKVGCLDGLAVLTGWLSPNIFRHAKHFL
jgi:uncharacterized membrane protein YdjX (TVP38/TMEM64 family)